MTRRLRRDLTLIGFAAWASAAAALPPPIDASQTLEVWLAPAPGEGQRPCAQANTKPEGWTLVLDGVLLRGRMADDWGALTGRWVAPGWHPLPPSIEAWSGRCMQLRRHRQVVFQGEAIAEQRALPEDVPTAQLPSPRDNPTRVILRCPQGRCVP